jgi:hypothetical protein
MPTRTPAHCANRSPQAGGWRHARIAAGALALTWLALQLLASCIGPGLEPPEANANDRSPTPPPARSNADAGTHPPGSLDNTGGETTDPGPGDTADAALPAPQDPTFDPEEAGEDAGTDAP